MTKVINTRLLNSSFFPFRLPNGKMFPLNGTKVRFSEVNYKGYTSQQGMESGALRRNVNCI